MRKYFCRFVIAFSLFLGVSLSLAGQIIKPTYLNQSQGVSSSTINSVMQDSYGFLWFAGENGVQRYDGFSFKNFQHDPRDSTSLMDNLCWNISELSNGDLWIGNESGLSRYDRAKDEFINYRLNIETLNPGSGRVFGVYEDSQNRLWCGSGTNGLWRYSPEKDQWQKVIPEEMTNDGGTTLGFVEDADGGLWWSDSAFGLWYWKPGDDGFKLYSSVKDAPWTSTEGTISRLYIDSREKLWITTRNGVHRLDISTGNFKTFATYDYRQLEIWNNWNCIREDQNGDIWIANNFRGMLRFENGGDEFERIEIEGVTKMGDQGYDLTLTQFCIDKTGIFWFGTRGKGVMKFDPVDKLFTTYSFQNNLPGSISSNAVYHIAESEKNPGNIYIGYVGAGIDLFDPNTKKFTNIPIRGVNDMFGGSARAIAETADGGLLTGTWGDGIVELNGQFSEVERYTAGGGDHDIPNDFVRVLRKDADGNYWVGTRGGLAYWDRKTGEFETIQSNQQRRLKKSIENKVYANLSRPDTISILRVGDFAKLSRSFEVDVEGQYLIAGQEEATSALAVDYGFIANEQGEKIWSAESWNNSFWGGGDVKNRAHFDVVNLTPGKYTLNYVSDDSHSYGAFNSTEPDFPEWWGVVIAPIDDLALAENIKALSSKEGSTKLMSDGDIRDIVLAGDIAWIGTGAGGLNRLNVKTGEVSIFKHDPLEDNSLAADEVFDLCLDSEGILWIGTAKGLNRFDIQEEQFTLYNRNSGLPANDITNIVEGDQGEMWIATLSGLSRMLTDGEMGNSTFINYDATDGLGGENFMTHAGIRSSDGTFYFGSDMGLTTFKRISGSDVPPDLVLSNFLISNRSVFAMGDERPFSSSLEGMDELELDYDQNDLSFEFTALHYTNPSKNQYAHKLEGVDDEWVYDNRNFVSYTNLEPGKYVLRLRGSNAYGVWTEEGKSIPITIAAPWWRTWWAYTAYVILFALIIFIFDRSVRQRIALREEKKNRERELAQAKEIEKAYHKLELSHEDLKSAQQQLVQQEKLASLGQLTAGIAHEIKNPLNFVNNFSELNIEMVDEVMEEIADLPPEKADPIKELLSDVRANLQKTLQHGTRADGIVKSMLQHSRGGSGKMEPTNLNALLEEYVNLAFHGMRASKNPMNVKLNFDLDENLGKVKLIGEDFSRVVLNLANNAFDAMRDKSQNQTDYMAELTVRSKRNGHRVEISITDNGPGIPDAVKDKILQPFFTTKKGTDGTGLGLSITNDIIKAHGGTIDIRSKPGETVFQIIIQR